MIKLQEKKYTWQELQEFKKEVANGNRNIDFLLVHIQAIRLLGWQIHLGSRIDHENMNNYYDVIKFTKQLKPRTSKLVIPGGTNGAKKKQQN